MPISEPIPQDAQALMRARFGLDDLPPEGPMVPTGRLVELAAALKDQGFRYFVYCAATHFPAKGETAERVRVAYRLRRFAATGARRTDTVAFRVEVASGESVPSLTGVFVGADWQEREQYDLVGVTFSGHPDLRRVMLPDDWVGHPLRKDYAIDTPCEPWR